MHPILNSWEFSQGEFSLVVEPEKKNYHDLNIAWMLYVVSVFAVKKKKKKKKWTDH